ncbi:MAG: cation diffusion facilitator family transporter [Dethiobacteria bacterium]
MRYLANYFADKVTQGRKLRDPAERHRLGVIESWTSIVGNIFLTLLKVFFGMLTNSISLIADAVHSASDIFSSLVVLIGFYLAKRKPDQEHPHGHGRVEYLAGLLISIMLIGAGIAFIYNSYNRLIEDSHGQSSIPAIAAVLLAILVKEFLYYFSERLGRLIDSDALIGDAWHHRSDSLSSILVLIALIGSYLGMPALDAYFGFAVAAFIIYAGYKIAYQSCSRLLGKAPDENLKNGVAECAGEIDGVIETHDLEIHDYGSWKVVTIHIGVNKSLSLEEAHGIARRVEDHISACYHCDTVVHLDPR